MSRRAEITMSPAERQAFLDEERTLTCASIGPGGRPHLMPLWYVREGDLIACWTYASSQKVKNLERLPQATLSVEAGERYEELRGVMLECDVEIVRDRERVLDIGEALAYRSRPAPAARPASLSGPAPRRAGPSAWACAFAPLASSPGTTTSWVAATDRMGWTFWLCALGLLAMRSLAAASDVEMPVREGHPRDRFPLKVYVAPLSDRSFEEVLGRVIWDWNAACRAVLGVEAFVVAKDEAGAQVTIRLATGRPRKLMGETETIGPTFIGPPVRSPCEPSTRGQTSRQTLLYEVAAHELGHALGLPHTADPGSVMCCVRHGMDFNDPAVRRAYVDARRNPDLHSVESQLKAHYAEFWRSR